MKNYPYLFIFFAFNFFNSQIIVNDISLPPDQFSSQILDTSFQNVYYQLTFSPDPNKKNNKREVVCVLELGEKFSRFGELNSIKYDSLVEKYSHLTVIGTKEMNNMYPFRPKWTPILLKNLKENQITIQDRAKYTYEYSEEFPNFDWKIENTTKEILGYACVKASTRFRGRKFIAWFAKELPINNGPYIFNGLPGLIMELEDSSNNYHFVAISLDKMNRDIYLRNEKEILKVSRDKFRQVQKSYYDNPGFFRGKAYSEDGSELVVKSKSLPYNIIELE